MIKNLIAAAMASILITQPPQNANDETYYQDVNITESYEYETNEVNSVDDLVVGNIYKLSINDTYKNAITNTRLVQFSAVYNWQWYQSNTFFTANFMNAPTGYSFGIYNSSTNIIVNLFDDTNSNVGTIAQVPLTVANYDCYIVYSSTINNAIIDCISASDYLGEKTITVERVETEGLYNLAYHFLYSRIYTNTELQGMETTLFGTTINMNMWLSHTTAIVIICLLLIVLIKFVIWLFKIVSGGMLWQ